MHFFVSLDELNMVPIAGITQSKHPSFRLESELTLSILRQPILYPQAFKSRQLGLTCELLGQLRSTQLASSLLACDERQTMVSQLDLHVITLTFHHHHYRYRIKRLWDRLLVTFYST